MTNEDEAPAPGQKPAEPIEIDDDSDLTSIVEENEDGEVIEKGNDKGKGRAIEAPEDDEDEDDDDEDEREEAGQLGEGGDDGERSDDDVPLSRWADRFTYPDLFTQSLSRSSSRLRRRRRADDDDE